jgi:aminoglycoside phosphotransferase (APT) family kinase protein
MDTQQSKESLTELLRQAGLPSAESVKAITERGFTNQISIVTLVDGQRVLLRVFHKLRTPAFPRARFFTNHNVPAPTLLAATEHAALEEFIDGETLGDLIDTGRDTDRVWRLVGEAYRKVHAVTFPTGLAGRVEPERFNLTPYDPAEELHTGIEEAKPGLQRLLPEQVAYLPDLHEVVRAAAPALQAAPSALGHGDNNMWNMLVSPDRATLVDWDTPRVADPAMEVALLDKHASLFNRAGIPPAFFDGYGTTPVEPNTSIHRVLQTMFWATGDDWINIERDPLVSAELKALHASWLQILLNHVRELPRHLDQLRALVA